MSKLEDLKDVSLRLMPRSQFDALVEARQRRQEQAHDSARPLTRCSQSNLWRDLLGGAGVILMVLIFIVAPLVMFS